MPRPPSKDAPRLCPDPKNLELIPDVWLTAYPIPYQAKTLTLSNEIK